jgi:hypothetical protein
MFELRKNTSRWVAYREAGMYPVQHNACILNMLTFLRRLRRVLLLDGREYAKIAKLQ